VGVVLVWGRDVQRLGGGISSPGVPNFRSVEVQNPDEVELSDGVLAYRTLLYVAGVIVGFGLGFVALLQQ
jgi:hypothetical protein